MTLQWCRCVLKSLSEKGRKFESKQTTLIVGRWLQIARRRFAADFVSREHSLLCAGLRDECRSSATVLLTARCSDVQRAFVAVRQTHARGRRAASRVFLINSDCMSQTNSLVKIQLLAKYLSCRCWLSELQLPEDSRGITSQLQCIVMGM